MADQHANFATSNVATAPSPATSGTSLVVTAGTGTLFPTPPFNAVVCPSGLAPTSINAEIVRVTGISTDTFTITRTQESTSARSVLVGDQIFEAITAHSFADYLAISNNLSDLNSPATARTNLGFARGQVTLSWSAAQTATATITHNLGTSPGSAIATCNQQFTNTLVLSLDTFSTTQMRLTGWLGSVTTGSLSIGWLASL